MAPSRTAPTELGWGRVAFSLVVLITLGLAGLIGLMVGLMALRLNFLLPGPFAQMTHFTEAHHRIHDLIFSFLLGTAAVGMLAQLRTPSKNVAGQVMALIPIFGLTLAAALTNAQVLQIPWVVVGASTLLASMLHPTARNLFRSFSVSRVNRVMLALVLLAAVPLLAFAFTNITLQRAGPSDHAALGHYGFLAAFGFSVIGVGLLASLRPHGWRLTAWVAGFLPALLGLASVVFPDVDSSLGLVWALAAIAWAVAFIVAAELARRPTADMHAVDLPRNADSGNDTVDRTGVGHGGRSTTGTPGSVYVVGILVIALVLLFVGQHLIGGGLGGLHTPPGQ